MSLKPKPVDFPSVWEGLLKTLKSVVNLEAVDRREWNDRFSDVYQLCVAQPETYSEQLYNETKYFLEQHVIAIKGNLSRNGNTLLAYENAWTNYSKGAIYLNSLYGYLNKQHVNANKHSTADIKFGQSLIMDNSLKEIGELAFEIWKSRLLEQMSNDLVSLILDCIKNERAGYAQRESVIFTVIHSYVNVDQYLSEKFHLSTYERLFEKRYLEDTTEYYQKETSKLMSSSTCSEYMQCVLDRLLDEHRRCQRYLHRSSHDKVIEKCRQQMVSFQSKFLLAEAPHILVNSRYPDLNNMYQLLKPIKEGMEELNNIFYNHVRLCGLEAVGAVLNASMQNESLSTHFVDAVLNVHNKYTKLIHEYLDCDNQFIATLDRAFIVIVNGKQCRSSELLSKYCDLLLKKNVKGLSESEIDEKLNFAITVFKYIDEKDVFQRFFSRSLAKRLIHGLSVSMDSEEAMINRLKLACGYEFTSKLHRMFTDINVSADLNSKFASYLSKSNNELGIGFSIQILQAGAWPLNQSPSPTLSIPIELERCVQSFETFYNNNFNGRKLSWLHYLCTGDVTLNYLKKPYIVTMTTYQMAILLLFNGVEHLTMQELVRSALVQEKELTRIVQSLIDAKILSTNNNPLDFDSQIAVNYDFCNKRTKFKITLVMQKETPAEIEQTKSAVEEDRKMFIQAAIVRIMKARKALKHNDLIQAVINQSKLRFTPSVPMIKKSIESLIDKQYIERSAHSSDEYNYLA